MSASLLFLMAHCCCDEIYYQFMFRSYCKVQSFGMDIHLWFGELSVGQEFHPLLLYLRMCCVVDVLISPGESFCSMLLLWHACRVWNLLVCRSFSLVCCDACAFSTNLETFFRTLLGSSDVRSSNVWSVLVVSASMVKLISRWNPGISI